MSKRSVKSPPPRSTPSFSSPCNRVVLKIGTSSLMNATTGRPCLANMARLVEVIVDLKSNHNIQVVLVSSGAVGIGRLRMGHLQHKPSTLEQKQAYAAIGQGRLMSIYDDMFAAYDISIAQILVTHRDLSVSLQYRQTCTTLNHLLEMNVVPIVNENDVISSASIRFGDNDTLSAMVAVMIKAQYLAIFTDVDGISTHNPSTHPEQAERIARISSETQLDQLFHKSSAETTLGSDQPISSNKVGTGGIVTKFAAARLAGDSGCATLIVLGSQPEHVVDMILHKKQDHGTLIDVMPVSSEPTRRKKTQKWFWLMHHIVPQGTLELDRGAIKAITQRYQNLLSVGCVSVQGAFLAQSSVWLKDVESQEIIGRGLVNYSSEEIRKIVKCHTWQIREILGSTYADCLIDRQNMAFREDVELDN